VCDSLVSLQHPTVLTDAPTFDRSVLSFAYIPRAPHAHMLSHIYPASRSQASPARI